MRGMVFPKTFDIKVFLNNESVCHFMVVQHSRPIHTRLLYIYITKPVWYHGLTLTAWTWKKDHIVSCRKPEPRLQISACKANFSPTELCLQTIPDCIRYIIGVFYYNLVMHLGLG